MRNKICFIASIMTIFLISQLSFAQEPEKDIANSLTILMDQIRNHKPQTVSNKEIIKILAVDPQIVLKNLAPYEKDTSPRVRRQALAYSWSIAKNNQDPGIRHEVTSRLVNGLNDSDTLVWQHAGEYLLDFTEKDFAEAAKTVVHQLFMKGDPERQYYIIRVIGVANMKEEMKKLGELLIEESKYETGDHVGRWYGTDGWAARLALARMGSKADIARAIELVESEPDKSTRVTTLLHDIAYIRQPEAIEVLRRYLESDERLPRVKETAPGSRYCQYALDILAQIIDKFPVKSVGPGGYSQSEIELARNWMKNKNNWMNSIRR